VVVTDVEQGADVAFAQEAVEELAEKLWNWFIFNRLD
jgi:sulfate adenylyltransferase subunit 1